MLLGQEEESISYIKTQLLSGFEGRLEVEQQPREGR